MAGELSDESVAGEKRQNKLDDYSRKAVMKKLEKIEKKLDKAVGGDQPDGKDQIKVWKNGGPGHQKIAKVIQKAKQVDEDNLQRISAGEVETTVGRSRSRTLEIMRELDSEHPDLKFKNFGGNRGSYLYWKGD